MRNLITILFLFLSALSFGADRYWVGGGSSANWNATGPTNWAATSGGAGNQSVPGSGDNVFFDANGNSASTISATITVLSLTIDAGYTATMTHSAVLTIAGNVTFGANYTIAGASNITISAASTITSNGKTWPNGVTFTNTNTKTLSGDWTISGTLTVTGTTTFNKTTAEVMNCSGLAGSGGCSGTITIILKGGTLSHSNVLSFTELKFDGTITVSGTITISGITLTYVSGTVTTGSSTLSIVAAVTLNTNGITWNNINLANGLTITINSLLSATGTLNIGSTGATFTGSAGFTVGTLTNSPISAQTISLNDGNTYTVTTALTLNTTRIGSILLITSDHASNTAALNLSPGATCNVLANFTRITNSGRTIRTFNGTVTSCTGIVAFNDIGTSKH